MATINITPNGTRTFYTNHTGFEEAEFIFDNWDNYSIYPLGLRNRDVIDNPTERNLSGLLNYIIIQFKVINLSRDLYEVYNGIDNDLTYEEYFWVDNTHKNDTLSLRITVNDWREDALVYTSGQLGGRDYLEDTYQLQVKNYDYINDTLIDQTLTFTFRIYPWIGSVHDITIIGTSGPHGLKMSKINYFEREGYNNNLTFDKTNVYLNSSSYNSSYTILVYAESYTYDDRSGIYTTPTATHYHYYIMRCVFKQPISFENDSINVKINGSTIGSIYNATTTSAFTLNVEISSVYTISQVNITTSSFTVTTVSNSDKNNSTYSIAFTHDGAGWYKSGPIQIQIVSNIGTVSKTFTINAPNKSVNSNIAITHNINYTVPSDGAITMRATLYFSDSDISNVVKLYVGGSQVRYWETDPDIYQDSLYISFDITVTSGTVVKLEYSAVDVTSISYGVNFTFSSMVIFPGFNQGLPEPKISFDGTILSSSGNTFNLYITDNIEVTITKVDEFYGQEMKFSVFVSSNGGYILYAESPLLLTTNSFGIIPASIFYGVTNQRVIFRVYANANNSNIYESNYDVQINVSNPISFLKIESGNGVYNINTSPSLGFTKEYEIQKNTNNKYEIQANENTIKIYFTGIEDTNAKITSDSGATQIINSSRNSNNLFYEVNINTFTTSLLVVLKDVINFNFEFEKLNNIQLIQTPEYILSNDTGINYISNKNKIVFSLTTPINSSSSIVLIKGNDIVDIKNDLVNLTTNTYSYSSYFLTSGSLFALVYDEQFIEFNFTLQASEPTITSQFRNLVNTVNFNDTFWLRDSSVGTTFKFMIYANTPISITQENYSFDIDMNLQQLKQNVITHYKILDSSDNIISYGLKVEKYDTSVSIDDFVTSTTTYIPTLSFITDYISQVIDSSKSLDCIIQFTGHIVVDTTGTYILSSSLSSTSMKIWINDTEPSGSYTFNANIPYSIRIISKNNNPVLTFNGTNIRSIVAPINIGSGNVSFLYSNLNCIKQNITNNDLNLSLVSNDNKSLLYQDQDNSIYLVSPQKEFSITKTYSIQGSTITVMLFKVGSTFSTFSVHDSNTLISSMQTGSSGVAYLRYEIQKNAETVTLDFPFILKLVDFTAFHTPVIEQIPESILNLKNKNKFFFNISDNSLKFSENSKNFDTSIKTKISTISTTGENGIYDESGNLIGIVTKVDVGKIELNNLSSSINNVMFKIPNGIDFTHENKRLTFNTKNTIQGIKSLIDTTQVEQNITSSDVSVPINADLEAIISCIPS